MAWWNAPGGADTPPVTIQRVAAWFDSQGYRYDLVPEEGGLHSGFGGHPFVVQVVNDDLMAVQARCWTNLPDDEDTATALRGLLGELNRNRTMPALASYADDDGRQVAAQVPVAISEGLNDDQLADVLGTCLSAVMSTFEEICDALGIAPGGPADDPGADDADDAVGPAGGG